MNEKLREVLEWCFCIVIAVILALLVRFFIGTPTIVQQPSMYPTLKQNQRLILNRWSRTIHQVPIRGEIVTFEAPSEKYLSENKIDKNNPVAVYNKQIEGPIKKLLYYVLEMGKESYIKRVIGLPGERVEIKNGKVYIDGEQLEEDYLQPGIVTDVGSYNNFVVPEGYVFCMGDNRTRSTDCRHFGCIPIEKLEGKVFIRFWPIDVFGKVK